jgi:uncharacterized protein (TIGR03118 family)
MTMTASVLSSALLKSVAHAVIIATSILGTAAAGVAAGFVETDLISNVSPLTDSNGIVHTTPIQDGKLLNPWGLAASTTSPFWVADNGAGVSTLYNVPVPPASVSKNPLVVSIPAPGGMAGHPTGVVFNIAPGAFNITKGTTTASASFLFATEDGTILGWSSMVDAANAIIVVPKPGVMASGAVYKGLAIATDASAMPTPTTRLYATNFHKGTVEMFDETFVDVTPPGAFTDPNLPKGYAPFNIVPIAGNLVVTYAVQDADKHDDVAGMSHGIVNIFDLKGRFLQRLIQHGQLNSPWGVALAPHTFGALADKLLIGKFGNGHINAYDRTTGEFIDKVRDAHGQAIVIDGLWSLRVGSGVTSSPPADRNFGPNTVFFTAGPNGENDGLFGAINPSP